MNKLHKSIGFSLALGVAWNVSAQQQFDEVLMEEIIVTGSLIQGTPEDAALPVDSITADDLELRGSPPPLEMLKSLSYMNGIVGESNQFTAGRGQAAQGTASVNLRGFGAERTLVLLNGKRLSSEDANRLPANAIARVEVLKDGGAVTYGSDAIGGVVNYITKDNIEGFELSADYRGIDNSDGDYNLGATWGFAADNVDFFAALNWYHRSDLAIEDQDWALTPYTENPQGGWGTGANPPASGIPSAGVPGFVDPGCELFGGVVTNTDGVPDSAGNTCNTRYTEWDNLVEEQDSYQAFASYVMYLGDTTELNVEALYAETEVPYAHTTPSYTTANAVPGALTGGSGFNPYYFVPDSHPGLVDMASRGEWNLIGFVPTLLQLNRWRPFFAGGNPANNYQESWQEYEREHYRLSTELTGEFSDAVSYTTSLSYSQADDTRREIDIRIDRLQMALMGYGGENCAGILGGGTPGVGGCMYYNPFSNAIPTVPLTGEDNPYFVPALENSVALVDWMSGQHESTITDELVEFNFVLDGEMAAELGGGLIGWAAGLQYRHEATDVIYNEFADQTTNPCPIYGDTSCVGDPELEGSSPWTFLATYTPFEEDREVKAVFAELFLPFTDDFTAQLAARYEDYGNAGGDSFDPNLRLRWQANDWLAFRASAGTTFRAAPQASLRPVETTFFAYVAGNNVPISISGNPDLIPEESNNYNLGIMLSGVSWDVTIDFWRFEIDNILTTEPRNGILDIIYDGEEFDCSAASQTFIDQYFEFAGGSCATNATLTGMNLSQINGAGITNDGVDIQGRYTWDEVGPGSLSLGGSATKISSFETDTLEVDGVVLEEGFDGVGFFNSGTTLFSLPELRGNLFLDYAMDTQNLRWTISYVDSYEDQREDIFVNFAEGKTIDSIITHNLTYRNDLSDLLTLTASIDNLTDEDPPFARTEINYDPLTHTPLGRTVKVGAKLKF